MGANDPDALEDSFEIEVSQLSGSSPRAALRFWRARLPDTASNAGERRRRYSRVATLVAIACLVLINSLNLTGLFPTNLPFVSSSFTGNRLIAHAAGDSWFALRKRPLHLPTLTDGAACPATPLSKLQLDLRTVTGIGDSTIFAATQYMDANGVQRPVRSNFFHLAATYRGELVTWYLKFPGVQSVLIRGARIDGSEPLLFDGGIGQSNFDRNYMGGRTLSELLLSSDPSHGTPVASWTTITRVASSGCYAYQVDTPTKSVVLVFRAVVER
jgi:hypothetical protein